MSNKKKYGLGRFMFDLIMTCATGGLWLLYKIFKATR